MENSDYETINKRTVRQQFEFWVAQDVGTSTERYRTFPFSYKMHELEGMFIAWKAAKERYQL